MGIDRRMTFCGLLALVGAAVTGSEATANKSAKRRRQRLKRLASKNYRLCVQQTPLPPESICYETDLACCHHMRTINLNEGWRDYCQCLQETSCSECV